MDILLRELCRLHNVPLPSNLDSLSIQYPFPGAAAVQMHQQQQGAQIEEIESDEDVVGESEQESEGEEDLPLEMDDGRNANKVSSDKQDFCFLNLIVISKP